MLNGILCYGHDKVNTGSVLCFEPIFLQMAEFIMRIRVVLLKAELNFHNLLKPEQFRI